MDLIGSLLFLIWIIYCIISWIKSIIDYDTWKMMHPDSKKKDYKT